MFMYDWCYLFFISTIPVNKFFLILQIQYEFYFFFKFRICMQLKIWRKDYFRFWSIQILLHNHINLSIGNNAQHHSFYEAAIQINIILIEPEMLKTHTSECEV